MTSYEIIDLIWDSINPVLLLIAVGVSISDLIKKKTIRAGAGLGYLVASICLVYFVQYIDDSLNVWPYFNSQYSTHTAFAIAVSFAITVSRQWHKCLAAIFLVYVFLMLFQQYHTILDIVSTVIVMGLPLTLLKRASS